MAPPQRRSIPTIWRGTRYRSKLEADWARAFHGLGVEAEYEPEGRYYGDTFYLPDFRLPASGQLVEVKAETTPDDVRKWLAVLEHTPPRRFTCDVTPDIPLIIARPGGVFDGFRRPRPATPFADFLLDHSRPVDLARCSQCRGWWFLDGDGGWNCQCCGLSDGARTLADLRLSPLDPWPAVLAGEVG